MGKFIKGDVVVIPFPFSDMTDAKKRPALVISETFGKDVILLQITSRSVRDDFAIELLPNDFSDGELKQISNIRPNKIFTFDESLILYKVGTIKKDKYKNVIENVIKTIS